MSGQIELDVFEIEIDVFRSLGEFSGWLESKGAEPHSGASYGQAAHVLDSEGVSWFAIFIADDAPLKTYVHEAVHLADWVMENAGIPCTAENTEVRAYLTAHIFDGLEKVE